MLRTKDRTSLLLAVLLFAAWTPLALTPLVAGMDRAITLLVQRYASPLLDVTFALITIAGNIEVTVVLVLLIGLVLIRSGRVEMALTLWALFAGGSIVEWIIKHHLPHFGVLLPHRRPHLNLLHRMIRTPYSYPSGHAFRTLLLGVAACMTWWPSTDGARGLRRPGVVVGVVAGLMGFALVYLGDHWASEVVGGYLMAMLCILPMNWVASTQRRGPPGGNVVIEGSR